MKHSRSFGVIAVLTYVLLPLFAVAQSAPIQDSITQQEQKLAQARAVKDTRQVITQLNVLASLYRLAGQLQKALDCLNEALPIEQKYSSLMGQATSLSSMGRVYTDMGLEDKALAALNQALPLWRAVGARPGEAETLNSIGKVYNNLGQHDQALKFLNQSMAI